MTEPQLVVLSTLGDRNNQPSHIILYRGLLKTTFPYHSKLSSRKIIRNSVNGVSSDYRFESSGMISVENAWVLAFPFWWNLGLLIHSMIWITMGLQNYIHPSTLIKKNVIPRCVTSIFPHRMWNIELWLEMANNLVPRESNIPSAYDGLCKISFERYGNFSNTG